jgi:YVTN family beta-propeller protein
MVLLTYTPSKRVKSSGEALVNSPEVLPRLKPAKRVYRKLPRGYGRLWRFKAFCLGISLPASILGTYLFATEILMPGGEVARSLYEWEIAVSELPPEPTRDRWLEVENAVNQAISLTATAQTKAQWRSAKSYWQEAIAILDTLPPDHPQFPQIPSLKAEYQQQLDIVQETLWADPTPMTLQHVIRGNLSPKSIVHSGNGLFFAQNMMYSHTVTVYDREYNLVGTIPDRVDLEAFGHTEYSGLFQGSPVEAAFSHNGKYAWVSNYQMYGPGFNRPGDDVCHPDANFDPSTLYRINTETLQIENVIWVGSVPKYVATTPNNRLVLVSNWCSWDLSIIDTQQNQEIKRIPLDAYPRGIEVDSQSQFAYIAIMGSDDIAKVNLNNYSVQWFNQVGITPRHLNLDPLESYLYVSFNLDNEVGKLDLKTGKIISKVSTGSAPRSMVLSEDGQFLYVVNYNSNTLSKVRTQDMKVLQTVSTEAAPIGVTYDPQTHQIWVACYTGSLMIFQD